MGHFTILLNLVFSVTLTIAGAENTRSSSNNMITICLTIHLVRDFVSL